MGPSWRCLREEQTAVMADDANWTVLKSYTGNEENVTDDPVESQVAGRIYRLEGHRWRRQHVERSGYCPDL